MKEIEKKKGDDADFSERQMIKVNRITRCLIQSFFESIDKSWIKKERGSSRAKRKITKRRIKRNQRSQKSTAKKRRENGNPTIRKATEDLQKKAKLQKKKSNIQKTQQRKMRKNKLFQPFDSFLATITFNLSAIASNFTKASLIFSTSFLFSDGNESFSAFA